MDEAENPRNLSWNDQKQAGRIKQKGGVSAQTFARKRWRSGQFGISTSHFMEIEDWQKSSLLSLEELTTEEIECILRQASKFKDEISNPNRQTDYLKGKRVVNLFLEPSTRTRIAFEIAAKSLCADVISISGKSSSLTKEKPKRHGTERTSLGADLIVVRHSRPGHLSSCREQLTSPLSMRETEPMSILVKALDILPCVRKSEVSKEGK